MVPGFIQGTHVYCFYFSGYHRFYLSFGRSFFYQSAQQNQPDHEPGLESMVAPGGVVGSFSGEGLVHDLSDGDG